MYASTLRSSPTAELLGTTFSSAYTGGIGGVGLSGLTQPGGGGYFTSSSLPFRSAYDTGAHHVGHSGHGGGGHPSSLLGVPTSPPRRRYSIAGLPSASVSEYLNLMQSANESAHISNLLNETSRSITRSSQILGVSGDPALQPNAPSATAAYASALSGLLAEQQLGSAGVGVGGAAGLSNVDHLLPLPYATNFSSHPNIYAPQPTASSLLTSAYTTPGLGGGSSFYPDPLASAAAAANSALTAQFGPLDHHGTGYHSTKSYPSFLYSRPTQHTATGGHLPYAAPLSSASAAYPLSTPYVRAMSQSRQNLYVPAHHTSNPALSTAGLGLASSSNWLPTDLGAGGCYGATTTTTGLGGSPYHSATAAAAAAGYPLSSASYGAGLGGGIGGGTLGGGGGGIGGGGVGYSNQHFDHHYYPSDPLSRLDLDYSRQGEQKRQVSFKFDVDTLSVDS